jgi:hypothetical protein
MLAGNNNWVLSNTESKSQKNYSTALASINLADGRQPKHETSSQFIPRQARQEQISVRRRPRRKTEETRCAGCGSSRANVNRYTVNIAI